MWSNTPPHFGATVFFARFPFRKKFANPLRSEFRSSSILAFSFIENPCFVYFLWMFIAIIAVYFFSVNIFLFLFRNCIRFSCVASLILPFSVFLFFCSVCVRRIRGNWLVSFRKWEGCSWLIWMATSILASTAKLISLWLKMLFLRFV